MKKEIPDVSNHKKSCICLDCESSFESINAKRAGINIKDICKSCQGTGTYYRQKNEYGFGVCPFCQGRGRKYKIEEIK